MTILLFSYRMSLIERVIAALAPDLYSFVLSTNVAETLSTLDQGHLSAVLVDMDHPESKELLMLLALRPADYGVAVLMLLRPRSSNVNLSFPGHNLRHYQYVDPLFNPKELVLILFRAISGIKNQRRSDSNL